jgi:hypothetical protein
MDRNPYALGGQFYENDKRKKIDEKRAITPRWVIKFTSKLQGR